MGDSNPGVAGAGWAPAGRSAGGGSDGGSGAARVSPTTAELVAPNTSLTVIVTVTLPAMYSGRARYQGSGVERSAT